MRSVRVRVPGTWYPVPYPTGTVPPRLLPDVFCHPSFFFSDLKNRINFLYLIGSSLFSITCQVSANHQLSFIQVQKIYSGHPPIFYSIFDWLTATLNCNSLFSTHMLGPMLAPLVIPACQGLAGLKELILRPAAGRRRPLSYILFDF
jgi:hypothetical protein